jgi:hypothetical protein
MRKMKAPETLCAVQQVPHPFTHFVCADLPPPKPGYLSHFPHLGFPTATSSLASHQLLPVLSACSFPLLPLHATVTESSCGGTTTAIMPAELHVRTVEPRTAAPH